MTKMEKALSQRSKMAKQYIENNKRYFMHDYCMSSDQLTIVERAFNEGFMKGVTFK